MKGEKLERKVKRENPLLQFILNQFHACLANTIQGGYLINGDLNYKKIETGDYFDPCLSDTLEMKFTFNAVLIVSGR